jgi:hypothetical protein
MCFFDQFQFSCGDWKWGNFRQHCSREYRTGETCGMMLVMGTYRLNELCKVCRKIQTKLQRVETSLARIQRWQELRTNDLAATEAVEDDIRTLEKIDHIKRLREENDTWSLDLTRKEARIKRISLDIEVLRWMVSPSTDINNVLYKELRLATTPSPLQGRTIPR